MILQPRARIAIALIAAYAVALQALLLAVVAPTAGAAGVVPICASVGDRAAALGGDGQAGHGQDCLDACLNGCCCGAPLLPAPPRALYFAPQPLRALAAAPQSYASVPIRSA